MPHKQWAMLATIWTWRSSWVLVYIGLIISACLYQFKLIMALNFWVRSHIDNGHELHLSHKKLSFDLLFGKSWPLTGPHSKVVDLEKAPHGKEFKILQRDCTNNHYHSFRISTFCIDENSLPWLKLILEP